MQRDSDNVSDYEMPIKPSVSFYVIYLKDLLSRFDHSDPIHHCFCVQNIIYVHVNSNITQIYKCVRAFAGLRQALTNFYM